jgi:Uma2 family endonuclease
MSWVNTSPLVRRFTLEEFWQLPEPPERLKAELIAGFIFLTPPPSFKHEKIASRLNFQLVTTLASIANDGSVFVPRAAICQGPNTQLEPDMFYLSKQTSAVLGAKLRTTADLVIEVTSPGSAIYDRNTKADTYAALGVKELWLVDEIDEFVEVRCLKEDRYNEGTILRKGEPLTSAVIAGLVIDVTKIFED